MLVSALFTSCVKEDMDDCMNVAVCFQYNADGQDNVLQNYIHDIDLYVFAQNGSMHSRIPIGKEYLTNEAKFKELQLPAGKYSLVAVANAYDRTEVKSAGGNLEHTFIQHPQWQSETVLPGQDENYLGRCEFQVPGYHTLQKDTIQLFSAHLDAYVEVHGLQPPLRSDEAASTGYRISIVNANAQTNLLNQVQPGQWATVAQELHFDAETQTYKTSGLILFRMDNKGCIDESLCRHEIRLEDGNGKLITSFPLSEYLKENAKYIDVTKQEAYLPISIKFTPVGVTIEVPSWYIEDITPDWT